MLFSSSGTAIAATSAGIVLSTCSPFLPPLPLHLPLPLFSKDYFNDRKVQTFGSSSGGWRVIHGRKENEGMRGGDERMELWGRVFMERREGKREKEGSLLLELKILDLSTIKTIPTPIYSDIANASNFTPLTCVVCLSKFKNDEKAHVLPNCNHAFHVDCMDMWFYTHSNCPLCRALV
ncbi:hypothetical protein Gotur_033744 [Gossypium turneri]